jgi:hypothetical protein
MNARCANLHRSIGRIHQIPSTASKYLAVPVCSEYIGYMVLVWPSSMANGNIDCTPYLPDFSAYIQLKKKFSAYTAPYLEFSSSLDLEEYKLH